MISRDYLMRIIEQLVVALERILHLQDTGRYEDAETEIRVTCRKLLGFDLSFIEPLADSDIIKLLGGTGRLDTPKCHALGILLARRAELRAIAGDEDASLRLSVKALRLLLEAHLDAGASIMKDHAAVTEALIERLESFDLPQAIKEKLFAYFEMGGRYDKAEDALFDIVAMDSGIRERGIAFYKRLMLKTDAELSAGNLPRTEVEEGLATLERTGAHA